MTYNLRLVSVKTYLQKKGWVISEYNRIADKITFNSEGEDFEIIIPNKEEVSDYDFRIEQLINSLSSIEKRSANQITEEIENMGFDIMQFRFVSASYGAGTMPLTNFAKAIESIGDNMKTKIMENMLYYGDNLKILRDHIKDESIDLIYLDPPFNSNATYNLLFKEEGWEAQSKSQIEAFTDFWNWDAEAQKTYEYLTTTNDEGKVPYGVSSIIKTLNEFLEETAMSAYLVMMAVRLLELKRVLKPTGSIYLHCDPTASHYIKLILDAIFGLQNFRNEIIWYYSTSGRPKDRFAWKHDTIFCYGKTKDTYFNVKEAKIPYSDEYIKTHFPYKDDDGRLYRKRFDAGKWRIYYADEGMIPNDVWAIPYVNSMSTERLGYPTQKPLPLLETIIKSSSKEGDVILDPFCGCGTTIDAVEKLNRTQNVKRNWIGIDITHLAVNLIKKRIKDKYPDTDFKIIGEPTDLSGAKDLALRDKIQFELWAVALVGARPVKTDKGRDGMILLKNPNEKSGISKVIVQVKGGEHLNPSFVRDLRGTIEREGKKEIAFGLLITMEKPTDGMVKEASSAGFYKIPLANQDIPKIEIITIKELVEDGKIPKVIEILGRANISLPKAEISEEEQKEQEKLKRKGHYKKL